MRGPSRGMRPLTPSRRPASLGPIVQGFAAMLPLWTAAIPVGMAYGVAAGSAGLGPGLTQLMSLVVFSASAQVSAVSLLSHGAPLVLLVGTAMALNAQLLLLGLSIGRQESLSWPKRLLVAWFLTDGAYGISAARGLRLPILLGAGVSMFVGWNGGTLLGIVAGRVLPDGQRYGIGFVVPLTFLALLVPLVRTRATLLVALIASGATALLTRIVPGGLAVLGACLLASAAGAWWTRRAGDTPAGAVSADLEVGT